MNVVSDPRAFRAKIEKYLARISELGRGGGYVTYAIRDPRGGDPRDPTDGPPFYVGQTADLGRRARQHFRKGGSKTNGGTDVAARIYLILTAGKLPIFDVLERAATRTASLESEAFWARKFSEAGHDLANRWSEHKLGCPIPLAIPTKRLWTFTLEQAEIDEIKIEIHCIKCGLEAPLPLGELIARSRPTVRLSDIRAALSCPNCGNNRCVRMRRTPMSQSVSDGLRARAGRGDARTQ